MKLTITIDGVEREYQGDYYDLHIRDWNGRVRDFLDDVHEYDRPVEEIPTFEGTLDALDELGINKKGDVQV